MGKENLGEFEELVLLMVALLEEGAYGLGICDELRRQTGRLATIGENIQESLKHIEELWDEHAQKAPMDFYFLDSAIEKQYRSELNFRTIFSSMTVLSLFLACVGLLGLVVFATAQRSKEIGIRKILGAPTINLIALLSREFTLLLLLSNLIAWPVTYYAVGRWLENFAYRINIELNVFLVSGLIVMVVALISVGHQTFKTASANPVNSLRVE